MSRSASKSGEIAAVLNPALTDPSLGYIPGFNVGSIVVPGLSSAGGGPGATDYASLEFTSYQASQDVFILRGRHSFKLGFNVERMRNDFDTPNLTGGAFNFGTLANFLRNVPSRFGALYPQSDTHAQHARDAARRLHPGRPAAGQHADAEPRPALRDDDHPDRGRRQGRAAEEPHRSDRDGRRQDSRQQPDAEELRARGIGVAWDPFGTRTTAIRGGIGVFDVLPFLYLYETPLNRSLPFFLQGNSINPPPGSFPSERVRAPRLAEPAHGVGRPESAARLSHAVERRRPAADRRLDARKSATSAPAA